MCPHFLSIGMTYNQYWYEDPYIAMYYIRADEQRRKDQNYGYWLQGLYIQDAIYALIDDNHAYTDKPYPTDAKEARERQEQEYRKSIEAFRVKAQMINEARRKGGESGGVSN